MVTKYSVKCSVGRDDFDKSVTGSSCIATVGLWYLNTVDKIIKAQYKSSFQLYNLDSKYICYYYITRPSPAIASVPISNASPAANVDSEKLMLHIPRNKEVNKKRCIIWSQMYLFLNIAENVFTLLRSEANIIVLKMKHSSSHMRVGSIKVEGCYRASHTRKILQTSIWSPVRYNNVLW